MSKPSKGPYHGESKGERRDRLSGSSDRDKMSMARKADIELAKQVSRRQWINWYIASDAAFMILALTATLTVAWWVFDEESRTTSVAGNEIMQTQEWGISITGVAVKIAYCRTDIDSCYTERDRVTSYCPVIYIYPPPARLHR